MPYTSAEVAPINSASEYRAAEVRAPGPALAWMAVVTLCLCQIVSTVDRGMLALVIDPVRHDLRITDVQIALLQGFAFSVFYVTMGLPLGAIADRVNRRRLLIAGILVWSAATVAGGLSRSFGEMFASRLLIGVGEAVLGPCAVTMISDLFPPSARGRPIAVYVFGSMIAYGIGSLVSGFILQAAPLGAFDGIVFLRGLAAWRIAFVLVGGFGAVLVALLVFLREPERQGAERTSEGVSSLRPTLLYFRAHRRLLLPFYGSLALFAFGGAVPSSWGAVLLTRRFGLTMAGAGKSLGASQILWAVAGVILAGFLVDRIARRGGPAAKLRAGALFAVIAIPSCLAAIASGGVSAGWLLGEIMFSSALYGTTMLSIVAEIVPAHARGLSVALYAFVMTTIGASLGPLAVAALTQYGFRNPEAVGFSMAIVGVVGLALSGMLALLASRRLHETMSADGPLRTAAEVGRSHS